MLRHPTLDQLVNLRLAGMAQALRDQWDHAGSVADLSFEDRLGLLVDREATLRKDRNFQQRLRQARIPQQATLEDLDFQPSRGLHRPAVMALADGHWVRQHTGVLITGATGVGKSFLVCALAHLACRLAFRTLYQRLPRLLQELSLAKADGRYLKLLAMLSRVEVLVIDDWGMAPLRAEHRRDLLEIMEDRYQRYPTVIASQYPVSEWHQLIGNPTMADAILDRLIHTAYRFELKGESMRKERSKLTSKPKEST